MRLDPADQDVVAVDDQVVRGDGRAEVFGVRLHVIHAVGGGDMLHHHPQAGRGAADRIQHAVDEHRLAVENVDVVVRDLAMYAERQADLGHFFQHRADLVEIRHAGGGVGRGPRRIKLQRLDETRGGGGFDVGRVRILGR